MIGVQQEPKLRGSKMKHIQVSERGIPKSTRNSASQKMGFSSNPAHRSSTGNLKRSSGNPGAHAQAEGDNKSKTGMIQISINKTGYDIRAKLQIMTDQVNGLAEELAVYDREMRILWSQQETLQNIMNMQNQKVKKTLTNEIYKVKDEMKKHVTHQKVENRKILEQIVQLKSTKTALAQEMLALQRRMAEIELMVGQEVHKPVERME